MTDNIPDLHLTADTIYLARYRYVTAQKLTEKPDPNNPELERISNINPNALAQFQRHYNSDSITEDDLFHYTYGILHSQQWHTAFSNDLAKDAARIPMADTYDNFRAFVKAGHELEDLHLHYESAELYPLKEIHSEDWDETSTNPYQVDKMAYAGVRPNLDKSQIVYNAHITLADIPDIAYEYQLGSRSALDWLIERHQVRTESNSGITNDPNDWGMGHDDPRYILDLVKRVTTVSVKTIEIVKTLPKLPI